MTKEKKDNIKNMHNLNKLLQESADLEVVVGALRKTLGYTVSGITLTELVPKVIQLLNSHNIAFAVAGGFARSVYAPYRLTRDIDLSSYFYSFFLKISILDVFRQLFRKL